MTWPKLITGILALCGGGWAIVTLTLNPLESRVTSIDDSIRAAVDRASTSEVSIRDLIAQNKRQLDQTSAVLDGLSSTLGDLTKSVDGLGANVAELNKSVAALSASFEVADARNRDFENLVTERLLYLTPNYRRQMEGR